MGFINHLITGGPHLVGKESEDILSPRLSKEIILIMALRETTTRSGLIIPMFFSLIKLVQLM